MPYIRKPVFHKSYFARFSALYKAQRSYKNLWYKRFWHIGTIIGLMSLRSKSSVQTSNSVSFSRNNFPLFVWRKHAISASFSITGSWWEREGLEKNRKIDKRRGGEGRGAYQAPKSKCCAKSHVFVPSTSREQRLLLLWYSQRDYKYRMAVPRQTLQNEGIIKKTQCTNARQGKKILQNAL